MLPGLPPPPPDADLVDQITYWENVKNAAAAAQYDAIHAFARQRAQVELDGGLVAPEHVERSLAVQVGYACRVAPSEGRNRLLSARDLHTGHHHIHTLFTQGLISEYQVTTLTRATRYLDPDERAEADQQLAERHVENLGVRRMADLARKLAAEIAPETFAARARAAKKGRHVSLRPAADGMAYLSALLPAEQGIACLGALAKAAQQAAVSPDPVTRGRGEIMADTLVERITGQAVAEDVHVEVQVIVPVEALLDPDSELPAILPGHGPIPLERILTHHNEKSLRRLLTREGIVIGGDSRQRAFTGALATFIRARDGGRCREPYCDAPIRQLDHIQRCADDGATEFDNGRGLCELHNLVRENPGWGAKRNADATIVTTTPAGHDYESKPDYSGPLTRRPHRRVRRDIRWRGIKGESYVARHVIVHLDEVAHPHTG
jgi:Domain of unknown function (DUF222)